MIPHGKVKDGLDWGVVFDHLKDVPLDALSAQLHLAVFSNQYLLAVAAHQSGDKTAFKNKIRAFYSEHKERLDSAMNLAFEDVAPNWFELTYKEAFKEAL